MHAQETHRRAKSRDVRLPLPSSAAFWKHSIAFPGPSAGSCCSRCILRKQPPAPHSHAGPMLGPFSKAVFFQTPATTSTSIAQHSGLTRAGSSLPSGLARPLPPTTLPHPPHRLQSSTSAARKPDAQHASARCNVLKKKRGKQGFWRGSETCHFASNDALSDAHTRCSLPDRCELPAGPTHARRVSSCQQATCARMQRSRRMCAGRRRKSGG
eukprot:1979434-Rhodomonas_salina.1